MKTRVLTFLLGFALAVGTAQGAIFINSFWTAAPPATDPQFSNVVALLHLDEADGSTSYDDIVDATNWTASGDAQSDTAQSKWGGASLLLDGSGDFISHADAAKYSFVNLDWCVEAWIRFNGAPGATTQAIASQFVATGQRSWGFYYTSSTLAMATSQFSGAPVVKSVAWSPAGDTWYHVAVVRASNSMYFFVDGALLSTQAHSTGLFNSNAALTVGAYNGGNYFNGWIDDFRLTIGVVGGGAGRYTATFTPPIAAFPNS